MYVDILYICIYIYHFKGCQTVLEAASNKRARSVDIRVPLRFREGGPGFCSTPDCSRPRCGQRYAVNAQIWELSAAPRVFPGCCKCWIAVKGLLVIWTSWGFGVYGRRGCRDFAHVLLAVCKNCPETHASVPKALSSSEPGSHARRLARGGRKELLDLPSEVPFIKLQVRSKRGDTTFLYPHGNSSPLPEAPPQAPGMRKALLPRSLKPMPDLEP